MTLTNFINLPVLRYLGICNVLYIWSVRAIPTLAFLVYHDQRIPTLIAMTFEVGTYIDVHDMHQSDSARIPFEVFLTSCLFENFMLSPI